MEDESDKEIVLHAITNANKGKSTMATIKTGEVKNSMVHVTTVAHMETKLEFVGH